MSTDQTSLVMLVGCFIAIVVLLRTVSLSKGLRFLFKADLVLIGISILVLVYRVVTGDASWPNW